MTEGTAGSTRSRAFVESLLVAAAIVIPVAIVGLAGEQLPPVVGLAVSLLTLPVAALLCWLLMRSHGSGWKGLGLGRPARWAASLGLGVGAGVAILVVAVVVINPVVHRWVGALIDPAMLDPLRGDVGRLVINVLLVSWLHAALSEEIIFRGFLLQRLECAFGGGHGGLRLALILQALLFGLAHYPQGVGGIVATAIGGILWGAAFLLAGRNLWVVIVGHATMDTILFVLVFLGLHRWVLPG